MREVENFAERVVLTTAKEKVLTAGYFRRLQRRSHRATEGGAGREDGSAKGVAPGPAPETHGEPGGGIDTSWPMKEAIEPMVDRLERAYLAACLAEHRGRVGAAKRAGISRRTLLRKMTKYRLAKEEFRP